MVIGRMYRRSTELPKRRIGYTSVVGLDGGLNYAKPSTMIADGETPKCMDVRFREHRVIKAKGSSYFAGTDVVPLTGAVMHIDQYYKTTGVDKLMLHTVSNVYAYNTASLLPECITFGEVVEDCEDVWSVNANVTCAVDTDSRKGTNSVKLTIAAGFTTGVSGYEDFASDDFSAYTHLHFYIKSDIGTSAGDLQLVLGDTTGGGTPVGGSDSGRFNVPALVAGVWQEVSIAITTPGDLTTVESVALYVKVDNGAQVVHVDDVMVTTERTGDEDDFYASEVINDYYVSSQGIAPIRYWDMSADTMAALPGCTNLAAKAMGKLGERLCLYHVIDTGTAYPRRVQWTVVGGLSTPPVATDWTDAGSGYVDLESVMGSDFILTKEKLGDYMIIYGERTVVMQEYTGEVSNPFAFYSRVSGRGLAAPQAIVNLGGVHIFLGWDDVYSYSGGKDVDSIGGKMVDKLFTLMNPEYIHRSFMVYVEEDKEIHLYYVPVGETTPTAYFTYNLENQSWSKGVGSYTAFGYYNKVSSDTWHTIDGDGNTLWNNVVGLWNDSIREALSPLTVFGDTSGVLYTDDESVYDRVGVAVDGWWETKDFVIGDRYIGTTTYWSTLNFEALGHTVDVSYSTDFGDTWSSVETFTLTSSWSMHTFDFEVYSPQVRFRFRNNTSGETFEIRQIEPGVVELSDRGV